MVPDDRPHVMEGVVGILLTARRLLGAGERRIVGEHVPAVPTNWPLKGWVYCHLCWVYHLGFIDAKENSKLGVITWLYCHLWFNAARMAGQLILLN